MMGHLGNSDFCPTFREPGELEAAIEGPEEQEQDQEQEGIKSALSPSGRAPTFSPGEGIAVKHFAQLNLGRVGQVSQIP